MRRVDVPPDTETLREIAETTEGRFFASSSGADLVDVYEDLGSRVGFVEEQEVTVAFAGAAFALMLAGGGLSALWFNRFP